MNSGEAIGNAIREHITHDTFRYLAQEITRISSFGDDWEADKKFFFQSLTTQVVICVGGVIGRAYSSGLITS